MCAGSTYLPPCLVISEDSGLPAAGNGQEEIWGPSKPIIQIISCWFLWVFVGFCWLLLVFFRVRIRTQVRTQDCLVLEAAFYQSFGIEPGTFHSGRPPVSLTNRRPSGRDEVND